MRLLVTGFGPFPTMPRNPSGDLARRVAAAPRWRRLGVAAEARILTTAYAALATELAPALASGPDVVLMLGVAGRSRQVRVETRATGRRSILFPDVAGVTARPRQADRGGAVRISSLPGPMALRILRQAGLAARTSRDAGRYLCNASYFQALADERPTLFVHIPKRLRSRTARGRPQALDAALAGALASVAILLLRQARRRHASV